MVFKLSMVFVVTLLENITLHSAYYIIFYLILKFSRYWYDIIYRCLMYTNPSSFDLKGHNLQVEMFHIYDGS